MKTCNVCFSEKSSDCFSKHSKSKDGRNWTCKDCSNTKARAWRDANPDARKKYNLVKYGISVSDWDAMFSDQGGVCAICGRRQELHVDHDHETGTVRGLLCRNCNLGLGQFFDNEEIMFDAIQYLKDRKAVK